MIYVSEVKDFAPNETETILQKQVYSTLQNLQIPFERVETDPVITMEDCVAVNEKLQMEMVKTLFLCNRQKTEFYLFITCGNKPFSSKNFSSSLGVSRVSFAPAQLMESMLQTKIGAATVFSVMLKTANGVKLVFDKDVLVQEYYGCSDGTTTGYLKIKTNDIFNKMLPSLNCGYAVAEI